MSFKAINLSESMIKSLNRQGFSEPSEIQLRAIPKALKGETLMVQSATGTGKTLCFLIPIIDQIDLKNQNVQSIIIAPTRELAKQIYDFAAPFMQEFPGLKIRLFKSGVEREETEKGLSVPPHIIIGTPGRLADILGKNLSLRFVNTIVLDEADRMLDMGFEMAVTGILSNHYVRKLINLSDLGKTFNKVHALDVFFGLIIVLMLTSFILPYIEPAITNVGDAWWYCFALITTIGFGDFTCVTAVGRILSVIIGFYGIIIVSLLTSSLVLYITSENEKAEKEIATVKEENYVIEEPSEPIVEQVVEEKPKEAKAKTKAKAKTNPVEKKENSIAAKSKAKKN